MTLGHLVGYDPATERMVILRKGADGGAVRQVDTTTIVEANALGRELIRVTRLLIVTSEPPADIIRTSLEPDPVQVELDIPEE